MFGGALRAEPASVELLLGQAAALTGMARYEEALRDIFLGGDWQDREGGVYGRRQLRATHLGRAKALGRRTVGYAFLVCGRLVEWRRVLDNCHS